MRRFVLATLAFLVVVFSGVLALRGKGTSSHREVAHVEFKEQVVLLGTILQGKYVIVHDEDRMLQGEPCTYLFKGSVDRPDKLVVSFRCQPVAREKAQHFTVLTSRVDEAMQRVQEIQFAGSTTGHRVP
ncbi:MAG: hypothetical protein HY315_09300 [Acidobacteria bacterium]|nr:hypothetical protein [Acidobacteriota bacterium]